MTTEMDEVTSTRSPEHRTVSRVMALLEVVIASEPSGLRLADLADLVGAPKSSIHGLAKGLAATGYFREHQGRYFTGPAVAMLSIGRGDVAATYRHALEELSSTWNETATLATLAGESVIHLAKVEPKQTIRASPPLHERRPMWPGSSGKVFLAFMEPIRRERYINRTQKDAVERARINAELEAVRANRVAFNRGEMDPALYGVASPILVPGMEISLAIGVSGLGSRMTDRIDEIADSVRRTAEKLSGSAD
ncbi:IclR family transcriptional regulator [Arthrobacter gyeryongensis]|uniref:IclR family transcriptional regulator n=1 Tax=Arthrobacter gyeryongensis TaxID=1650592 RepID=A0ABP9SA17_9MICC